MAAAAAEKAEKDKADKADNPVGEFFEGFVTATFAVTCCSPRAQRPPGAAKENARPTKPLPAGGMPAGGSPSK